MYSFLAHPKRLTLSRGTWLSGQTTSSRRKPNLGGVAMRSDEYTDGIAMRIRTFHGRNMSSPQTADPQLSDRLDNDFLFSSLAKRSSVLRGSRVHCCFCAKSSPPKNPSHKARPGNPPRTRYKKRERAQHLVNSLTGSSGEVK